MTFENRQQQEQLTKYAREVFHNGKMLSALFHTADQQIDNTYKTPLFSAAHNFEFNFSHATSCLCSFDI